MLEIRKQAPNHFFLVPGVGAQGGDFHAVCDYGFNKNCGLLINASRSIIYSGSGKSFKDNVRKSALDLQKKMELVLKNNNDL